MSRGIFCLRAMYGPKFTGPARKEFGPARRAGPGLRAARPVQTSSADIDADAPFLDDASHYNYLQQSGRHCV